MSRFINMDAHIINILLATVETSSETIFMTKPTKLSHFVFQEILKHKPEQADLAIYSYIHCAWIEGLPTKQNLYVISIF